MKGLGTKKEKENKAEMLYKRSMDDIIDMSNIFTTAMALQLVGLPTDCPSERIFFEDAESAVTFARIYTALANTGTGISKSTVEKVIKYLETEDYRSILHKEIRFSKENDAGYALWPQYNIKGNVRKKEAMQMSLFDLIPGKVI